jgi:hypothetical protein
VRTRRRVGTAPTPTTTTSSATAPPPHAQSPPSRRVHKRGEEMTGD